MQAMPDLSRALGDLAKLTRMGQSFSGKERNCCYLNVGGTNKHFANVSAVTGFDFPDDARAVALLDWDHDGDLDAWLTNRTAPRVRLLRNEGNSKNHFVAVRLEGTKCNRDAIGARVEVYIAARDDSPHARLVKTVRAGGGFVSQSSKWLSFGLGGSEQIQKVVVHWPGGEPESFEDIQIDSWCRLVQGSGKATNWNPPGRSFDLVVSTPKLPSPSGQTRSVVLVPPPLPRLQYTTLAGEPAVLGEQRQHPLLITLFKSDCPACLAELREFTTEQTILREAGVDMVAICVDGLTGDSDNVDATAAKAVIERLAFPFDAGLATPQMLDKFFLTIDQLYIRDVSPSVPTSMLLDTQGNLGAVYRGRVGVKQIAADANTLPLVAMDRRKAAAARAGHWLLPSYREDSHMSRVAIALAAHDYENASVEYVERNLKVVKDDPRYVMTLITAGGALLAKEDFVGAETKFREAAKHTPEDLDAKMGLATAIASQKRYPEAIPVYRTILKARPDDVEAMVGLGVALQFVNDPTEAIELYRKALDIHPEHGHANLYLAKFYRYTDRLDESLPHFQKALTSGVEPAEVQFELGMALLQQGETVTAREHLAEAGRESADFIGRMNMLAMRLATTPQPKAGERQQAIVLAEITAELTDDKHPALLDTLAVAYAGDNRFADAISIAEKALAIAKENPKAKSLIPGIQARLQLFHASKPFQPQPNGD